MLPRPLSVLQRRELRSRAVCGQPSLALREKKKGNEMEKEFVGERKKKGDTQISPPFRN